MQQSAKVQAKGEEKRKQRRTVRSAYEIREPGEQVVGTSLLRVS
jgi:hypothetical protein